MLKKIFNVFIMVQHHPQTFESIILGEKTGFTLIKTSRENLYEAIVFNILID